MSKQDRQGVRTTQGLERKYNFGNVFSRLNAENKEQNLTMRQFTELMVESITTIQKNIQSLTEKDTAIEKAIEKSEKSFTDKISAYWKTIYPVGSIYVSVSSTSPEKLFGGTWTQIQDRFLLAAGSSYAGGATGGEAEHILTEDEMPSHNHTPSTYDDAGSESGYKRNFTTNLAISSESIGRTAVGSGGSRYAMTATTNSDISETATTSKTGGSKAHNNMPPYLAVYVWKRTA
jgi:hypothetical protein